MRTFVKRRAIKRFLGEVLCERELITRQRLEQVLAHQKAHGGLFIQSLLSLGFVTEEELLLTLTEVYGFPYLPVANCEIDLAVLRLIPEAMTRTYVLLPVERIGNSLTIVMADPTDLQAIQAVEQFAGCVVQTFVSTLSDIQEEIELCYKFRAHVHRRTRALTEDASDFQGIPSTWARPSVSTPGTPAWDPSNVLTPVRPERRSGPRRAVRLAVTRLGSSRNAGVVWTKDLSTEGLCCVSEQLRDLSSMLKLEFDVPDGPRSIRIRSEGDVMRVDRFSTARGASIYHIAISFRWMNEEDRAAIAAYVQGTLSA